MKRWALIYLETVIMFVVTCGFVIYAGGVEPTMWDAVMFGICYTNIVDLRKDVRGW